MIIAPARSPLALQADRRFPAALFAPQDAKGFILYLAHPGADEAESGLILALAWKRASSQVAALTMSPLSPIGTFATAFGATTVAQ